MIVSATRIYLIGSLKLVVGKQIPNDQIITYEIVYIIVDRLTKTQIKVDLNPTDAPS